MRGGDENARRRSVKRVSADLERLRRERNMHYIPFSQAVKGAVFLIDQVKNVTWDAERMARRVVGRDYAHDLLQAMIDVRPPPPEPACASFCLSSWISLCSFSFSCWLSTSAFCAMATPCPSTAAW